MSRVLKAAARLPIRQMRQDQVLHRYYESALIQGVKSSNERIYHERTRGYSVDSASNQPSTTSASSTLAEDKTQETQPKDETQSETQPQPLDADNISTHFGFQTVRKEVKSTLVGNVFSSVASSYDIMNDLMSGGMHRLWKDQFVANMKAENPALSILDVAGGTGDIAFRIAETRRRAKSGTGMGAGASSILNSVMPFISSVLPAATNLNNILGSSSRPSGSHDASFAMPVMVCDINPDMLEVGKKRAEARGISSSEVSFFQGDAEKLPVDDESVDIYCISFGMRNVTNPDQALREAMRVLKKGGRFMMLEFGHVDNPAISQAYDMFSFNVIPAMGSVVASDRESYKYLVESIRKFPGQEAFSGMMTNAGFGAVTYTNYTFGVVAEYSGFKM